MTDQRLIRQFEELHRDGHEPWSFSERAVELLRHERLAELVASLAPRRVLEVGCSLGLLTARLAAISAQLVAMDLSQNALGRARQLLRQRTPADRVPPFVRGSATRLPFAGRSFDLVLAADGLYTWELTHEERADTLRRMHDVLVPGGHLVLTEHMRPARFDAFVDEVRASPLRVVRVIYLHDRPFYQFESWIRAIQHWRVARALRRSMPLARALTRVGSWIGPRASRHVCVVAVRAT